MRNDFVVSKMNALAKVIKNAMRLGRNDFTETSHYISECSACSA